MGKLSYTFNPATSYKSGYAAGFKEGKDKAIDTTIEIFLQTVTLMLIDSDWTQEHIQEFADRLTRGIVFNSNHPDEWKQIYDEAMKEYDFVIEYKGEV